MSIHNELNNVSNFDEPVDFLIPWSGLCLENIDSQLIVNKRNSRFNNELIFCIKSIINNASWYNSIIIFLDNIPDLYKIISEELCKKYNIIPINRKSYFKKENYPTNNYFAICTTIHKIEILSEYFIIIHDDQLITRKTLKGQWFTSSKEPYVFYNGDFGKSGKNLYFAKENIHRIYVNPDVYNGISPKSIAPYPHFPIVLLKSFCTELANKYKSWYEFVQSHKTRFDSTNQEINMWFCEEDLNGVWPCELLSNNKGVPWFLNRESPQVLIEYTYLDKKKRKNFIQNVKENSTLFCNFNDNFNEKNYIRKQNDIIEKMKLISSEFTDDIPIKIII